MVEENTSIYEDRATKVQLTSWMKEPGENAPPLVPVAKHLVKTLPGQITSVYDGELPPLDEVTRITQNYLQVSNHESDNRGMKVFLIPSAVGGLLMGGFLIWTILSEWFFSTHPQIGPFEGLFLVATIVIFSRFLIWKGLRAVWYSYKDEPIRFHRESGKVYRFRSARTSYMGEDDAPTKGKPSILVYDWTELRGEIVRRTIFTGRTFHTMSFLQLAVLDPATEQVSDRFLVGHSGAAGDIVSPVILWETVRRFMAEGPARIPPATFHAHRDSLLDALDEYNPISMSDTKLPLVHRVVNVMGMAVMWIASIPMLFFSLFNWIGKRTGRTPDWGELDNTVFRINTDDSMAHSTRHPSVATPQAWAKEQKRRKRALLLWLASIAVQWLLIAAWLNLWPYCSCYNPDRFCLSVRAVCPNDNAYLDGAPAYMPAMPAPVPENTLPAEKSKQVRDPAIEAYEQLMRDREERRRQAQERQRTAQ